MATGARSVTDEPIRGSIPPPWFFSLPGIDRLHAFIRGLVPLPPAARLFGMRLGHISTGAATLTMPASANFLAIPHMDISPFVCATAWCAATTTVPAGFDVVPVTLSQGFFRPARPQPGNLLARARTLNASSMFVCVAIEVEDPVGRQLSHAVAQFAVRALEPPPPAIPSSLNPVEEPTYPTPDPPDRPFVGAGLPTELAARRSGLEIARMFVDGELPPVPIQHLVGIRWLRMSEDEVELVMPASEWFSLSTRDVGPHAVQCLIGGATSSAALTQIGAGQSATLLEVSTRFLRSVRADGRELSARGRVRHREGALILVESEVFDGDGALVATNSAAWSILEQRERQRVQPERVLATLLFTDIIGSTERAQQMGDAAWRALLGEHHALIRRELGAHRGREIKTIGDGFLVRFDSPASAVRCATAIRNGVRQLGLEIRAGVHTGECEVQGNDLAGIALHVAARIVALAGANEVVVSQIVKDLASGSGLRFAQRGSHTLKGIEGEWTLFAVDDV